MKYENFEDIPVWKDSIILTAKVFEITEDRSFQNRGDIANQLQRAALSVANNIAEGFERGTTPELIMFLYYSKGSAGEVRSICHVIDSIKAFDHLKSQISDLKSLAAKISRQLAGWAASLQETDIKGQRHLTMQSKEIYNREKQSSAFLNEIQERHNKRLREFAEKRLKK